MRSTTTWEVPYVTARWIPDGVAHCTVMALVNGQGFIFEELTGFHGTNIRAHKEINTSTIGRCDNDINKDNPPIDKNVV